MEKKNFRNPSKKIPIEDVPRELRVRIL